MKKNFLLILFFGVVIVVFIYLDLRNHGTDKVSYLEIDPGEVWEYLTSTYNLDESSIVSNYISFNNQHYYFFSQNKDRSTLLLITKSTKGFQSHIIKWEIGESPLSVHKIGEAFPESLILIQDDNIKSIEVIDQGHAWKINLDDKQAVFFPSAIEKVRAFDSHDQLTHEYDYTL